MMLNSGVLQDLFSMFRMCTGVCFSWSDIGMDHPFENCKDTVFFKTLEMAYMDGKR